MIRKVGIINYGAGNLMSISKAIDVLGYQPLIINSSPIKNCDVLILPGVGNFGSAMKMLNSTGLDEEIKKFFSLGKPILGICLGIQLVFNSSEEAKDVKGLSLVSGKVVKFSTRGLPVPHICWNIVRFKNKNTALLAGLRDEEYFYFVHSYYPLVSEKNIVFATTCYGVKFCSMIVKNNLVATQFHLEKSGDKGLKLLSNIMKYFELL
ncbi:MAG: imidazole glycerol phosphate synthase subunit HisH [Endomicrobia bacterium]|nr:imidazole glycerol phosphate synthase subunit HisH [Endomicrobiia bacterium]MCX7940168.1 imidazole glycerol phosphate synthase subunit HisH [Endomicrobiia bacterium]MDW8055688.1 imidazole glycerol phosphate synthase subunit HisH [Elusimicrobiota bacterium]